MTTVEIPESIDAAKAALNGLGRLLTATEWERAAIVAAFAGPAKEGVAGGGRKAGSRLSYSDFAALGIAGLKHRQTVAGYVDAWTENGKYEPPKQGDVVELPTRPFRLSDGNLARSTEQMVGDVKRALAQPEVVAAIPSSVKSSLVNALLDDAPEPRGTKASVKSSSDTANVAALGGLADMRHGAEVAVEVADFHALTDQQLAKAEVLIRATEASISIWRESVGGGVSDEAIAAFIEGGR